MATKILPLEIAEKQYRKAREIAEKQYREVGQIVNDLDLVLSTSNPTGSNMADVLKKANELQALVEKNTTPIIPERA